MTAYNIVRFRVKPGRDREFIDLHKASDHGFAGMRKFSMVKIGDGAYCVVGEWESFDHLAAARPGMIGMLDRFRHLLEDLGGGMGLTDPVSGHAVLEMGPKAKTKKKAAKRTKPKAKKAAAKKPVKKPAKKKPAKRRKR